MIPVFNAEECLVIVTLLRLGSKRHNNSSRSESRAFLPSLM
jgi:hypothetical protein